MRLLGLGPAPPKLAERPAGASANPTFSDLARQCNVGAEGDATDSSRVGVEPLWLRMPERTCSSVDLTTSMVFVTTVFVRSVDVTAVLLVRFWG